MQTPVSCWENMVGYLKTEEIVRSFEVVNDCAERASKLLSDFKDVCTNVKEQEDLFQVIEDYRTSFHSRTKDGLGGTSK